MTDRETKVLLVEDNESDIKQVIRLLKQAPDQHFEITSAKRLQSALEIIEKCRYDIILLDLGLPDSKGITTLDAIKRECQDIPVVIFTVSGNEEAGIEAISKGAQDYLVKGTSDERIITKSIRYAIERKRLEIEQFRVHEQLRQSEEQFRNIFNNAALGMVEYDSTHRFLSVNDHVCQILGYSREELLGKKVLDITAAEDLEITKKMNGMIHSGQAERFAYEKRYVRRDGTYMWAHVTLSAIRNSESFHILTVGTIEDISERKKAVQELKESEERFRTVFDSNMLAIAFWTTDGSLTEANQAFCSLIGVTSEEIMSGRIKWVDFTPPDILWRDQQGIAEINATGVCKPYEKKLIHRDGHTVPILIGGAAIAGRKDQGVAFAVDLSMLKEAEHALRESEERFRGLVLASSDVLYRMNPDWSEMIQLNSTGFLTETLQPNTSWRKEYIHPDDQTRVNTAIDKAIRTKSVFELEHHVVRQDGTIGWTFSRAVPILDNNGHIIEWFGAASDITARKQAELALQESEKKLKILNENLENIVIQRTEQVRSLSAALTFSEQRERKRFSYILHEGLQQKLLGARILLNQHTEEHKAVKDDSVREDLDEGIALLNNAIQITRTLSLELNPPILNTEGLDAALRWLCTYMHNNYMLNVDLQMQGPLDQIRNDTQMILTNMIRELLKNVVKHSSVLNAYVSVTCEHRQIQVIIKDEGKGFDVEKELKKSSQETKFGLFSVRERLSLFGGELLVESQIGYGTVCTINYPFTNC